MVTEASESASALVMLLAENLPCFDDSHQWVPSGGTARTVRFYKRAQILVAGNNLLPKIPTQLTWFSSL